MKNTKYSQYIRYIYSENMKEMSIFTEQKDIITFGMWSKTDIGYIGFNDEVPEEFVQYFRNLPSEYWLSDMDIEEKKTRLKEDISRTGKYMIQCSVASTRGNIITEANMAVYYKTWKERWYKCGMIRIDYFGDIEF